MDTDNPAFPRSSAYWWLGCSSASRGTVGGNARLTNPPSEDDDVGDIIFDAGMFRRPGATQTQTDFGITYDFQTHITIHNTKLLYTLEIK